MTPYPDYTLRYLLMASGRGGPLAIKKPFLKAGTQGSEDGPSTVRALKSEPARIGPGGKEIGLSDNVELLKCVFR